MSRDKNTINKNFNIPNAMSVFRILIIPFFATLFLKGYLLPSVLILVLSGLTDLFDGLIARKLDQVTELGKILDPLADKLTQGVVALCLALRFEQLRPLLVIFILKEGIMLCFAVVLLRKKKRPCAAMWYGKVSTFLFYISITVIVLMSGLPSVEPTIFIGVSNVLLTITIGFMLYSAVRYLLIFIETIRSDDDKYKFNISDEMRARKNRKSK